MSILFNENTLNARGKSNLADGTKIALHIKKPPPPGDVLEFRYPPMSGSVERGALVYKEYLRSSAKSRYFSELSGVQRDSFLLYLFRQCPTEVEGYPELLRAKIGKDKAVIVFKLVRGLKYKSEPVQLTGYEVEEE